MKKMNEYETAELFLEMKNEENCNMKYCHHFDVCRFRDGRAKESTACLDGLITALSYVPPEKRSSL